MLVLINWQCKIYWVLKLNSKVNASISCKTISYKMDIPKHLKSHRRYHDQVKKVNTCLASLAIEIGFPESNTLTWYTWTLLSNTFLIWSLLNLFSNTHTHTHKANVITTFKINHFCTNHTKKSFIFKSNKAIQITKTEP